MLTIPKIHHTVWVGPLDPPMKWINTWKEILPDWEHWLWTEDRIKARKWHNQRVIDYYMNTKQWPGVADTVRAELLYDYGGFTPGADSRCLRRIDELFMDPAYDAYCAYENEVMRGNLLTPLLASTRKNAWAWLTIKGIEQTERLGEPWQTTGNKLMTHLAGVHDIEGLKIWPSHYFIPNHYTGQKYTGDDEPYGEHLWGSTLKSYQYANL